MSEDIKPIQSIRPRQEDAAAKLEADQLEALLKRVKEAHTEFERTSGQKDADWTGWYANYMANELGGTADPARLKQLLTEAADKFSGEDWPGEYSKYMADKL